MLSVADSLTPTLAVVLLMRTRDKCFCVARGGHSVWWDILVGPILYDSPLSPSQSSLSASKAHLILFRTFSCFTHLHLQ